MTGNAFFAEVVGAVIQNCPVEQSTLPVTFKTDKAFVR
jgi:hypothetical protein